MAVADSLDCIAIFILNKNGVVEYLFWKQSITNLLRVGRVKFGIVWVFAKNQGRWKMVKVHCFAEKSEYIGVCPNSYQTLVSQIGTYKILVEDILSPNS